MAIIQKVIGTITAYRTTSSFTGTWGSWSTNGLMSYQLVSASSSGSGGRTYYPISICYRFELDNNIPNWIVEKIYFDAQAKPNRYEYESGYKDLELKATFFEQDPTTSSSTGYEGGTLSIPYETQATDHSVTYEANIPPFSGNKTFYVIIELMNGKNASAYFQPIEIGVSLVPPQLSFTTNKDTIKPGDDFYITFENRLNYEITTYIKYGEQYLDSDTFSSDTGQFTFLSNWIHLIDKTYGQFTIEASDDLERVATGTINFQLDSLEASIDKQTVETNTGASISVDNSYGQVLSYVILSGSTLINSDSSSEDVLELTPEPWWFSQVGNNSNSMSVTVNISDRFGRTVSVGFTVTAGPEMYPVIGDITLANVPAANMPPEYGYIANYSKVKISAPITKPSIASSVNVSVSYYGSEPIVMSYNDSTAQYEAITESVITGNTTFTIIAVDSNTRQAQKNKQLSNVETLSPITISLNNYSVNAGSTVIATVDGNVGDYGYVLKKDNSIIGRDSDLSGSTFSFAASASWFPNDPTVLSINIKITVTDVLGRTADNSFTVNLPQLTISLDKSIVIIEDQVQITLDGTSGQTVNIAFTTPKDDETVTVYSATVAGTSKNVSCLKSWFDQYDFYNDASLPITVIATAGAQTATAQFSLKYPDLGIAITKTVDSQEVAVTSATVGEELIYTFSNLEGESVNVDYYYQPQESSLLRYGPYHTAQTIATPQLFDLANPPVTKSQSMQVNIVISDVRGRTATVGNFTINVNAGTMSPSISNLTVTPVNDGVDHAFDGLFINKASKFLATVTVTPNTSAVIPNGNVYFVVQSSKYLMQSIGNNQFQYESQGAIVTETGYFTYSVEATDERGLRVLSAETSTPVEAYEFPSAKISYHRCNQDKSPNDSGYYCLLTCNYTFAGIPLRNVVPISYRNQGSVTVAESSTQYSETVNFVFHYDDVMPSGTLEFLVPNMSIEQTYQIAVTLTDLITSTAYTVTLSTGGAIMDFYRGGKGVAIGKVAEDENLLEVNPNWELRASVKINGQLYDLATLLSQIKQQLGI